MRTRRLLSLCIASTAVLTSATAFAQPVADLITTLTFAEDAAIDSGNSTISGATLLSNDPLIASATTCTNDNQCTAGDAAQDAHAVCADPNLADMDTTEYCHYPAAILSCEAGGGTIGVTCDVDANGSIFLGLAANTDYADDFDLTYTTSTGTATVTGTSGTAVSIARESDRATVTLGDSGYPCNGGSSDICLTEDQFDVFPLEVTTALGDTSTPDPAEVITQVDIDRIPEVVTLVCGSGLTCTRQGSCGADALCLWRVNDSGGGNITPGDLDVSLDFPEHYATFTGGPTPISMRFKARSDDRDATLNQGTPWVPLSIEIAEVADAPTVTPAPPMGGGPIFVSGLEDQDIPLGFASTLVDQDGSESLIVQISNMPDNGALTQGINQGGGTWDLTPAQLAAAAFYWVGDPMDPDHLDDNVTLTLTARAVEIYSNANGLPNSTAVTTRTISVQTNAVADGPQNFMVTDTASGNEDTQIALDISAELIDTDGSESLYFYITVPGGSSLTHGIDLNSGDGPNVTHQWQVSEADIGNVAFIPPTNDHGDFVLQVSAGTLEDRGVCAPGMGPPAADAGQECVPGSCTVSCERVIAFDGPESITVTVSAVADAPTLSSNGNISVDENGAAELTGFDSALVDTDESETCTMSLYWTGMAQSDTDGNFTFNVGMAGANPDTWEVNDCELADSLTITGPTNGHGTFTLCATVESTENDNPIAVATASSGPECITVTVNNNNRVCGDDFIDTNEGCDDGEDNADGPNTCREDCSVPSCGDGITDDGSYGGLALNEECDDAGNNSDTTPDACRTDCSAPRCGDNVVDSFDACDDGNNGIQTDACLDGCVAATCGDNFVWAGVEECDTGLARSDTQPDACRTTCLLAHCTDGVVDSGEACDDGNQDNTDGCPATCELATCGDGYTFLGMEECDQGANNSNVQPDACRTSCTLPACGDLVVDTGEECDDGNAVNEDACVNTCDLNFCGDGFVDLNNEECDEGDDNSNSTADTCRRDCTNPFCGDGVVDAGEACDLGPANDDNTTNPNGCKTNCSRPGCGDGVLGANELCDDGANNSNTDPDACRETCTPARCGDGVVDSNEVCDDGAANSNQIPNACRRNCMTASCGDGIIDAGETCDDGVNNSDTIPGACRTSCVVPSCGDGIQDPGESCDDGANNSDTASGACRTTCVVASCGDGVVDPGEACDEGSANGGANCDTDCTLPAACGDGVIDAGEECDDGSFNSDEDPDTCRSDCSNPFCGDGVVDTGEECDAGDQASDTCDSTCTIIDEPGEDMGMGGEDMGTGEEDMGGNNANNANNGTNNGTGGADMGGETTGGGEDMGGEPGVTPADEEGCCRTIRRNNDDSSAAGWLAMLALGFAFWRRRR